MVLSLSVEDLKKIIDANIQGNEMYQVVVDIDKVKLHYNGSYYDINLDEASLSEVIGYRALEIAQIRQDREDRFLDQLRYFIDLL